MLHCKQLSESLVLVKEFDGLYVNMTLTIDGTNHTCHSLIVYVGLNQVDPGLVPDGAKCAPEKMCVNQKCMRIDDLRKSVFGSAGGCPNNCGGNGVCNSLGHCHCNRGFGPPECVQPGYGGSDDSGPVGDPNGKMLE